MKKQSYKISNEKVNHMVNGIVGYYHCYGDLAKIYCKNKPYIMIYIATSNYFKNAAYSFNDNKFVDVNLYYELIQIGIEGQNYDKLTLTEMSNMIKENGGSFNPDAFQKKLSTVFFELNKNATEDEINELIENGSFSIIDKDRTNKTSTSCCG
ncbi:MAG: hypothetical protein MJ189_01790 [Coriobacteriales bacterium]|nr:hypothetical protein [Coriobacteriales bacterium]